MQKLVPDLFFDFLGISGPKGPHDPCKGPRRLQGFSSCLWLCRFAALTDLPSHLGMVRHWIMGFQHLQRVIEPELECLLVASNPLELGDTPSTAGTFRKKFRKNSGKTPETLSELLLEFSSRVRLGCPNPIIQGI